MKGVPYLGKCNSMPPVCAVCDWKAALQKGKGMMGGEAGGQAEHDSDAPF